MKEEQLDTIIDCFSFRKSDGVNGENDWTAASDLQFAAGYYGHCFSDPWFERQFVKAAGLRKKLMVRARQRMQNGDEALLLRAIAYERERSQEFIGLRGFQWFQFPLPPGLYFYEPDISKLKAL